VYSREVPGAFLDDAARTAFAGAIAATETSSAAEVVVAVRVRSRVWLHVHLIVGFVAAWLGLGFMLYSAHPFGLAAFLIDPVVVGAIAGLASTLSATLVRVMTPASVRRRAVAMAARAAFYDRGVHHTAGRSGVLVYIALTERMVEVVADDGVVKSVEPTAWAKACAAIDAAVVGGGAATGKALAGLAPILEVALPRHIEDLNELPDAIDEAG
jgi:putative membrane protein